MVSFHKMNSFVRELELRQPYKTVKNRKIKASFPKKKKLLVIKPSLLSLAKTLLAIQ
jgi:hypothetical protein